MQTDTQEFILEFKRLMENLEFILQNNHPITLEGSNDLLSEASASCSIRLNGVDTPNSKINGVKKIEN